MAQELQRKHPGFTPSCIQDIANQMNKEDADRALSEMEQQQQRRPQPIQQQTKPPKDSVPKEARHAPTIHELNEVREKYEQAARQLEGLIDLAFSAQQNHKQTTTTTTTPQSPLPSPTTSTQSNTSSGGSAPTSNHGPEVPFINAKLSTIEKNAIEYEFWIPAPTTTDWIAVFIHDRQLSHSGYEYTQGRNHGTGIFRGLCEGTFDIRLLRGRDSEHFITRSSPILIGSQIDLQVSGVTEEKLTVKYSIGSKGDWIGLYTSGSRSNKKYICYSYVSACNNGVAQFETPRQPGNYEVSFSFFSFFWNSKIKDQLWGVVKMITEGTNGITA